MSTCTIISKSGMKIDGAKLAEHVRELEDLDEQRIDLNKRFSQAYQSANDRGFNKKTVKAVVRRRKKDRDRVVAEESEIHDYEVALGMRTMEMDFAPPQSTDESLAPQADLTETEKADEEADAKANGEANPTQENAYDMGRAAKLKGEALDACPWKRSTKLGKAWTLGFNDAANEAAPDEPDEDQEEDDPVEEESLPEAAQGEDDDYQPGPSYTEGRHDYEKGKGPQACPYDQGTQEAADWVVGWNERAAEDQAEQPVAPDPPGHEDLTEHMSAEDYRKAVGADSL